MLDALVGGRVDALHLTPETGALVLSVWTPDGVRRLVMGVGPRVVGVAWGQRVPAYAASVKHPLPARQWERRGVALTRGGDTRREGEVASRNGESVNLGARERGRAQEFWRGVCAARRWTSYRLRRR